MPQTCFLAKAEVPVELFRFHPASRSNTAEATVLEEIEDSSTSALVILIVCPARKRSRNGGTSCNNVFSRTGLARTRSPQSTYTSYLSIANFFSVSKDSSKRVIIFARKPSFFDDAMELHCVFFAKPLLHQGHTARRKSPRKLLTQKDSLLERH